MSGIILRSGGPTPTSSGGDGIPVGAFIWHTGSTAPSGWLIADGAARLRSEYPALWAFAEGEIAIGNQMYGIGDGSTTFTIRTMANEFIRGKTGGRAIGSWEDSENKAHEHMITGNVDYTRGSSRPAFTDRFDEPRAIFSSPSGGSESRPRNIALLPIVKY